MAKTYKVISRSTGKVIATFSLKALADRHYWVLKGWAKVVKS
jgi:hypothetical protein